MQYTVNLYKADVNGSFVAKAYTQSALQRLLFDNHNGVCTRDTRLPNTQPPRWENRLESKTAVDAAYTFFFLQAAPDKQTGNCYLLLNDIKALRTNANATSGIDFLGLGRHIQSKGVCFLDNLMSYPRWIKYDGSIEVGGMFYYGRLLDEMDTAGNQSVRVATVAEREDAFMNALVGKNGFPTTEDYAKRNRAARGCIDEIVAGFRGLICELGTKACCNVTAMQLTAKIDALVELLGSCGINDFQTLDAACNAAEDALSAFCLALAAKQDAATQTPLKAELVGEQAEQLATSAENSEIAAARNKKELDAKSKGGKKGAKIANAERGEDKKRNAILTAAKKLLQEWDERYPNRHKPPKDLSHSDAAAFRIIANKHKDTNGVPIMSVETIGRTLRRKKNEKRGQYKRTGKSRGRYTKQT